MATAESRLIVSLIDRVTGPSRVIHSSLKRLNDLQARNDAALGAARMQMLDAIGAGYALARAISAPVKAFTEFEATLEDIAQKINKPRAEMPKLGAAIRQVARDTTNFSQEMGKGFDVLAGKGASEGDALGMLPDIGKAAVAYRADIADLANAGYAALDNLKIPANEFGMVLDGMAEAGKAGAFELKDMAKYFPQLGAAYQGLKQTGVPAAIDLAAALQIVNKGTGDAASAAGNLKNILQKIYAPGTLKKFSELGVNLRKEMAKAMKEGMTPIEAIAVITNKVLKGDLSRLGELFEDSEVQSGLRPLIQRIDEYRKIRADALKAQGVVEADYQERLKTGAMAGQRFAVAMESINLAVGEALMPALTDLANALVPVLNAIAKFAQENPQLTRFAVGAAAAIIGLNVALIAVRFGALFAFGGLLKLARGGLFAAGVVAKIGGAIGTLLGLGRRAATVLPASLEGFNRGSQAVARNSRAATAASRRMVQGMGAARQASDRMISGMAGAASKAPITGFATFGQRAGSAASTAFRAALKFSFVTMIAEMVADMERELEESFPLLKKINRAIPTPDQLGKWGGGWLREKVFGKPDDAPLPEQRPLPEAAPSRPAPLPVPRPPELIRLDEIAAASKVAFKSMSDGGADAGTAIESGARQGADLINSAADNLRRAGQEAGASISNARPQVPSPAYTGPVGRGAYKIGPNANLGQSMPNAGRLPGSN